MKKNDALIELGDIALELSKTLQYETSLLLIKSAASLERSQLILLKYEKPEEYKVLTELGIGGKDE